MIRLIIIGYPGIGKSSVSSSKISCIDLESSNFYHRGNRPNEWFIYYCNIALDLSKQGYIVFVSSHKLVRDYLLENKGNEDVYCVFPELYLKDDWVHRLGERYEQERCEKNYRALVNTEEQFEKNIEDMRNSGHEYYLITNIQYDLLDVVAKLLECRRSKLNES